MLLVAACQDVSVTTVPVNRIEVDPAVAVLQVNGSIRLTARVLSESGHVLPGRSVSWTSLNPAVATVDSDGNVTPVSEGTAVIRASSEGATADATVTVTSGPAIGLSTSIVSFSAPAGGANPPPQSIGITNAGGASLGGLAAAITYSGPAGWLNAALSGATAPATLTLSATTGALAPGTYQATVRVTSGQAANSPQQVQVTFTVTSTASAPGAPATLAAVALSTSRIDLTWAPSVGAVQQYRIQRRLAAGGTFAAIDSVGGGTLTYADDGLASGTGYVYRVQACGAGGCSGWSPEATATTLSGGSTTPGVPGSLTAARVAPNQIQLTWTSPGGQTHFEVRRRTGTGGSWTFDATVAGDATGFLDTGVHPSTTYQYQVRACGTGGCSDYSSPVTVGTWGGS
ncbi:MAG TPA: fibronectin type III domain-containing protein [Longimicrobiales bacterium]|nr:fibronectin type III domain-containing protein [Longimicrobiales bacterium]